MVQSTIKFRNVVIPIPKILEVWVKSTPVRKPVGSVGSVTVGITIQSYLCWEKKFVVKLLWITKQKLMSF